MPKEPKSPEDEFYRDLDLSTEKKSCCTCYTLVIFFAVILMTLIILIVFTFGAYRKKHIITTGKQSEISLPNANGQQNPLSIKISDQQMTDLLKTGLKESVISNPEAKIEPAAIILTGFYQKLFNIKIMLTILPTIKDNRIYFKIIKAEGWHLGLPGIARASLEGALNSALQAQFATTYQKYNLSDLQLEKNIMTIYVKLK